ncbi:MAG TPA: alpha-amylase family glycosyl hydrolase [Chitinophagaceae bacterium]|nr:alpha-amylase family glycosyl hydrolase [Chitinophagaceae bacterium]
MKPGASQAQDFMMQGFYWNFPKTGNGFDWADTLASKASQIAQAGFTYVWLPPFYRASSGNTSNGYDPYDLYDLGAYGLGPTGFGSASDVASLIAAFKNSHLNAIADVIYNHRNGGLAENNPVVQAYVDSAHTAACATNPLYNDPNFNPYPSDRFRYILPLGGSSGNGAGDYYFKISSLSQSSRYFNFPYTFYAQTNTVGYQNQGVLEQIKPDGGMDCGQPFNTVPLGVNMNATTSDGGLDVGGCFTDEYHIHIGNSDFNPAGDTLYLYISNLNGQYSDHRIYGVVDSTISSKDITGQLVLQTYTDFTHVASGQGRMNYTNFHPNGIDCSYLGKNWDYPYFFYDYDQDNPATDTALINWTEWLWNTVGVRGFRMDAVSDFNPKFAGQLLTALNDLSINPGLVVGENFDYTVSDVTGWINAVKSYMSAAAISAINVRAFDFPLRMTLKNACDQAGFDVRNIYTSGIAHNGGSPLNAVTFINNHDLRNPGDPIQHDPILAYAYIFTDNSIGIPCVFYPDYFGGSLPNYPDVYLKPIIDSLIALHKKYIFNAPTVEYLNALGSAYLGAPTDYLSAPAGAGPSTTLIYQISGGPSGKDVLVAINFAADTLKLQQQIDTHGGTLVAGSEFYDALNHSDFSNTPLSSGNTVYLELPPRSFSVWVNDSSLALQSEVINFSATPLLGTVKLSWQTSSEVNTAYFTIERSPDSTTWTTIGKVAAAGNSSVELNYGYNDNSPLNGISWYRLKQVDQDGRSVYSLVRKISYQAASGGGWMVFPNPTNGTVHILAPVGWNTTGVILVNAKGEQCPAGITIESAGSIQLDLSHLPGGIYFIEISSGNEIFKKELVRQ